MKKNVGHRPFVIVVTAAAALVIAIVCVAVVLLKRDRKPDVQISKTDIPSETQQRTSHLKSLEELDSVSVGDHFTFGSYPQYAEPETEKYDPEPIEWHVLDLQGDSVLIISEYLLAPIAYNRDLTEVTWETCSLRSWLNGTFYDTAFSESEKERIQTVINKNPDNPLYGTNGGSDTEDKVFCLNLEEAQVYFKDTRERSAAPTPYAINCGASTNNDYLLENGMNTGWWWLRSPASSVERAADVDCYGNIDISPDSGENGVDGDLVFDDNNCVRPVVLVSLSD